MNSQALVLRRPEGDSAPLTFDRIGTIEIEQNPEVIAQRNELLQLAQGIELIKTPIALEHAVEVLRKLKGAQKETETTRKQIKEPVSNLGKKVDEVAKTFIKPVDEEASRIQILINNYNAEQEKIRREEERKQKEEMERLEKLRLEEQQKAATSTNPQEIAAANAAQKQIKTAQSQTLVTKAPVKVTGTKSVSVWKYDVTDLLALVKHRPDLCRIEPNKVAIAEAIKGGMRECPGITNIREESEIRV